MRFAELPAERGSSPTWRPGGPWARPSTPPRADARTPGPAGRPRSQPTLSDAATSAGTRAWSSGRFSGRIRPTIRSVLHHVGGSMIWAHRPRCLRVLNPDHEISWGRRSDARPDPHGIMGQIPTSVPASPIVEAPGRSADAGAGPFQDAQRALHPYLGERA